MFFSRMEDDGLDELERMTEHELLELSVVPTSPEPAHEKGVSVKYRLRFARSRPQLTTRL